MPRPVPKDRPKTAYVADPGVRVGRMAAPSLSEGGGKQSLGLGGFVFGAGRQVCDVADVLFL